MSYKVAGIDIHKKVLMVVVADVTAEEWEFERRRFGTAAREREHLVAWLQQRGVQEIVMESTAQYWKPIWLDLEPHFRPLHLAQAHSNRAPKGRKQDFADAQRLTRRLVARRTDPEFRAGCATTRLADHHARQGATGAGPRAAAESAGSSAGRNAG